MLFNSIEFILFFLITTSVYFLIPHRLRWLLLLLASCYFYMYFIPVYILILGITISIDYLAGIWIEKTDGRVRTLLLLLSILSTCFVLLIFKYFNFVNDNVRILFGSFGLRYPVEALSILLPIGLSFHTFQSLSYVIEVYRGKQKAKHHFGIYSLYVMFYPQLVAGPIERPQNMLHQFYERHLFEYTRVSEGLKLMFWGFFKKLVIADRLALYVDSVYNNHTHHNGISLLVATIFFSFQVYCDFSGYTDIARGCAQVLGFNIMVNFKRPYFASSIREFWTRWHVSLSTWFRDYIYIPLGGSRVSKVRWRHNILIVFLISGLWHGANWTFVIWGLLHGALLMASDLFGKLKLKIVNLTGLRGRPKFHRVLGCILTFSLVSLAWVFFRADSVGQALEIIRRIFTMPGRLFMPDPPSLVYGVLGILILLVVETDVEFFGRKLLLLFENSNIHVRTFAYSMAVMLLIMIGVFDGGRFIYFQF